MTNSREAIMPNELRDEDWQARAGARTRRIRSIIGILFAAGLISGFLIGFYEDESVAFATGDSIPAWVAILGVVLFLAAMTLGNRRFLSAADELERRNNLLGTAAAGWTIMIGFPCWFLLWKGGLVPQPDALWLFAASFTASTGYYLYRKLR